MFSAQATTVITANEAVRDGKIIPLKAMVDEAVEECDCVKQVFVAQRTGVTVPMYGRDIPMEQVILVPYKKKDFSPLIARLHWEQWNCSEWLFNQ